MALLGVRYFPLTQVISPDAKLSGAFVIVSPICHAMFIKDDWS